MNERKKTSSMTELTKEVAKEVVYYEIKEHVIKYHSDEPENNKGEIWSKEEDQKLTDEFLLVLNMLGIAHGRTAGAIRCRIQQNNLL